jgi:MFS family permease
MTDCDEGVRMSTTAVQDPSVTRNRYLGTMAATCLAVFAAQYTNAMPGALNGTFQQVFHAAGTQLQWISAASMIPVVAFELTFGVLGDIWGRKKLLFAGTGLAVLGSIVIALAQTVQMMWVGQAIIGLAAGIMFPISLSLIAAVTPDLRSRSRSIAIWAGFLSIGAAASPLVGGFAAEHGAWRAAYVVAAVIGVIAVLLTFRVAESSAPEGRVLDIPGQVTLALGLLAVLFAIVQGSGVGWAKPEIIAGFVAGAALLVAFVVIELRSRVPLIRLSLFSNRAFAIAAVVAAVGMFGYLTYCFSMSIWISAAQHQNPLTIGILMVFVQGPAFVLIPVVSYLIRRVAPQFVLTVGFVLISAGAFLASRSDINDLAWATFILPSVLVGIGFAFTIGSITAVAINTVPLSYAGMASATTNMFRDLGFALGPVLGGAIGFSAAANRFVSSLSTSHLPPAVVGAAQHIPPLGAVNIPHFPAAGLALTALGHGFSLAFVVAALAALAAAVITLVGLHGIARQTEDAFTLEAEAA